MKQIPAWIFKLYIFACFVSGFRTLTPPRILYGGWTPIVPGHPFYFGPVAPPEEPKYHNHRHVHFGEPEHEVGHHVEYIRPEQFQSYNKPNEDYYVPAQESDLLDKGHQQITYGDHPQKDIFSYYPPQSSYEDPKEPQFDYKPVYFEIPRRPLDIFKNAHIASLKDLPIDLKSLHQVNGQASLKPVSDINLNVLKQIGHINAGRLHYVVPESKYPIIKDSSGRKPTSPSYNYKNPKHILVPYNVNQVPKSALNTYKGNAINEGKYLDLKRPLNPIETKYFRNPHLQALKPKPQNHITTLSGYKNFNLPVSPSPYRSNHNSYSGPRYLPLVRPQGLNSPYGSRNISPATKTFIVPTLPSYHSVRPIVPIKPAYPTVRYPSNKLSPNLLTNYLHKDVTLRSHYKNPAVVTSIHNTPAIVEREVAIIHVPATNSHYSHNSPNNEYLYHTASTPESTQILDISSFNESVPFTILNKHSPARNNESYTHISLDFGKDVEHMTLVEPSVNSQIDPPIEKDVNDTPNQYQYIFVSGNGLHGTDQYNDVDNYQTNEGSYSNNPTDGPKQYFHAYYGSSEHVPPPGYVKMTVGEFNNLFRNAEIRYVDKDLETESSVKREYRKPVDKKLINKG